MKSITKRILLFSGLSLGYLALFGAKKYKEAEKVLSNLQIGIKDISNISLSWEKVKFDIVALLHNPTDVNFGFTTSSRIFIKKLRLLNEAGKEIATGATKLYEIKLPAGSMMPLPSVSIEAPLQDLALQLLQKDGGKNLKISIDIEAFGRTFTIAQ